MQKNFVLKNQGCISSFILSLACKKWQIFGCYHVFIKDMLNYCTLKKINCSNCCYFRQSFKFQLLFFFFFGMSITYKIFGIKLLIFTGTVRRFLEKYVDDVDSVIFVCNEDTVVCNALFIQVSLVQHISLYNHAVLKFYF